MDDRQPPAQEPTNVPWGPPPAVPPTLSSQQPYADPFAGVQGAPTPEPPKRRREGLWIALASIVGAAVVIAGFAWYSQRETTDDVAGGQDLTTDTTAATPDEQPPADENADAEGDDQSDDEPLVDGANVACPEGTQQEVCDAARFVEDFRGRPFKTFPAVEFADEDAFQERLSELYEESTDDDAIAETKVAGDVLGSLGLIAPGVDLVEANRQLGELSPVGFYEPDAKELLVRGSEMNVYVELIIVHELVHAHDDQWLGLDLEAFEDAEDESGFGQRAVIEGNATRVEDVWRSQLSDDRKQELSRLEAATFSNEDIALLQSLPRFLLQLQSSPYVDGPELVRAIAASAGGGEAGESAVDEAIKNPPTTSEQVRHPEQYVAGQAAPLVPAPVATGEFVDEGVIGELIFDIWFGDDVGDGWNGDSYVSFERDGQTCTVVQVAADSSDDLDEFFDAAADWVGNAVADDFRRSDQRTVDGVDLVIIEGCR